MCGKPEKGGVIRIESAANVVVLMDVIFASNNKAYSSMANGNTGDIFSVVTLPLVYFMNMPVSSKMSMMDGSLTTELPLTPQSFCNANTYTANFCSEMYQGGGCVPDGTLTNERVLCTCGPGKAALHPVSATMKLFRLKHCRICADLVNATEVDFFFFL